MKFYWIISIMILAGCSEQAKKSSITQEREYIPTIDYVKVKTYPHDTTAFTEGLLLHDNKLYESTGAPRELAQTRSLFGIVDRENGQIDVKAELDRGRYFGEGITILNNKIYQLTYTSRKGFIYDLVSYIEIGEFEIPTKEGWGMTTDGTHLIMSDGTHELTYLNPETLQVVKKLPVSENRYAKQHLNELEFIKGYIFANIWKTNTIIKIDPSNGKVVGKLDLSNLANDAKATYDLSLEMNGIAYDSLTGNILVTGKLWPKMYELELVD